MDEECRAERGRKVKTKERYKIDCGVVWVTSFKGLQVTVRRGVGITTAGGVDEGA